MNIRKLTLEDEILIGPISLLHQQAFPDFFLTQLGPKFLKTLYEGYLHSGDSGIIIAEESDRLLGFIAYSNDYPKFYRDQIKYRLVKFAWYSFIAVLHHPLFLKRLLGAFKKSDSVVKKEKYVELASICVEPTLNGKGIGTRLIDYLKSITDFDTYEYINLETDADHNDPANQFYIKNDFILQRQYVTAEGRRMNEYRFVPESEK